MPTTETPTKPARLNTRDLRWVLYYAACGGRFPILPDGRYVPQSVGAHSQEWRDLCAVCGLTGEQLAAAIHDAARRGRLSIARELRAQRGGQQP